MRVISPDGTTNFPYVLDPDLTNRSPSVRAAAATTGDNTRDNVEQAHIANPTNGTYLVRVTHKGTLTNTNGQWVSVLLTGNIPQQPPPFAITQITQIDTNQLAIGWRAVVGQRYKLQTVSELSASNNWQNLGAEISARLTNVVVAVEMTNTQAFYRAVQMP